MNRHPFGFTFNPERASELLEDAREGVLIGTVAGLLTATAIAGFVLMLFTSPAPAAPRDANRNRTVIGGRPAGCPHAYCGCGLRKFLGLDDASLNLAWNWARKFRHTQAMPGAAAVRRHHVMLLVQHVAGSRWIVRDYNGGRHLSYIHERDVHGYVFVNPSARVAHR
jgi:hypothetical protein